MQIRFLFGNLTWFHHEHLVLILKQEITLLLVISGIRMYRNPLSYVPKCSYVIGVNDGNEKDNLLTTLKLLSRVVLTILTFVPYITSCIIPHRY
jgi:hypothetical protein